MTPESVEALRLLAAEDARQSKLHDLLETIREQIRLEIPPEHRPDGLFQNIQDAVYAMRGRTLLMNDAAITAPLSIYATPDALAALRIADQWIKVLVAELDIEPAETVITISATSTDGKRELAKVNLAESQAQIATVLATPGQSAVDPLRKPLEDILSVLSKHGEWDDGCFYYSGRSASELQRPIEAARAALAGAS